MTTLWDFIERAAILVALPIGFFWSIVGMSVYYRRKKHLPLFCGNVVLLVSLLTIVACRYVDSTPWGREWGIQLGKSLGVL